MFKNPTTNAAEAAGYHPRPSGNRKKTLDDILKECCPTNQQSFVKTHVENVLQQVAQELCEGNTVSLPNFGSFSISLKCKENSPSPDKMRSEYIELKSVGFTPSRTLLKDMTRAIKFKRSTGGGSSAAIDESSLIDIFADYFDETKDRSLTTSSFAKFYGLKDGKARRLIRTALKDGLLVNMAMHASSSVYVPGNELRDYMGMPLDPSLKAKSDYPLAGK